MTNALSAVALVGGWPFAGGTVDFASVQNDTFQLKDDVDAFEDGTPDFLSIAALPAGFDLLEGIGMSRIHKHVMRLTARFLAGLAAMVASYSACVVKCAGFNSRLPAQFTNPSNRPSPPTAASTSAKFVKSNWSRLRESRWTVAPSLSSNSLSAEPIALDADSTQYTRAS